eukprot:gene8703-1561_t
MTSKHRLLGLATAIWSSCQLATLSTALTVSDTPTCATFGSVYRYSNPSGPSISLSSGSLPSGIPHSLTGSGHHLTLFLRVTKPAKPKAKPATYFGQPVKEELDPTAMSKFLEYVGVPDNQKLVGKLARSMIPAFKDEICPRVDSGDFDYLADLAKPEKEKPAVAGVKGKLEEVGDE